MKTCRICAYGLLHKKDINLVAGTSEVRPIDYIVQLPFPVNNTSPYVCQKSKANLKAWFVARDKMCKLEMELKVLHIKAGYLCVNENDVSDNTCEKSRRKTRPECDKK